MDIVREDMQVEEDAEAGDRKKWRQFIRCGGPCNGGSQKKKKRL